MANKGCRKESNKFSYVYQITALKLRPQSVFTEIKNNSDSAVGEILTCNTALLPQVRRFKLPGVLLSLQVWETSASQKLEEILARVLVGICKPNDPVLEMNMTLCLSSGEICGQHQTLIKAFNTWCLMDCIWEKKARLLCRRYLGSRQVCND